jgi:hypothetical protein
MAALRPARKVPTTHAPEARHKSQGRVVRFSMANAAQADTDRLWKEIPFSPLSPWVESPMVTVGSESELVRTW